MKKTFTLLMLIVIAAYAFSQVPAKMSYQAIVRNSNGDLLSNSTVGIRISILKDNPDGPAVFVETHATTSNKDGLVTIEIGGGTTVTGTLNGIDWSTGSFFIKTETDPDGGADYSISGTSQLLSVPYAFYANTTGQPFSIPGQAEGDMMYYNGTSWERLPRGTAGQVLTINTQGKYIWVNQFSASTATTAGITNITESSVTLNGSVNANGFNTIVTFEYGPTASYGQSINAVPSPVTGNKNTPVNATITGIPAGTVYHYRIKSVNDFGTSYGNDMVTRNFPAVTTAPVNNIAQTTAVSGGTITADGGSSITWRGVCWGLNPNPTLTDSKTMDGSGIGTFTSNMASLTPGTTYHLRAYAINSVGASYGNDIIFTTLTSFPSNGLVASYPFNGNANDESTNANNGIAVGASLTTDRNGNVNKAYYFDGTSNYIKITGALPITNTFTISFWALSERASGYNNILCDGGSDASGNDFLINFRGNDIGIRADKNNLPLNYEDSSPEALSGLDLLNKWVHVVWVMNPDQSKIYLNGVLITQINEAGTNEGYHDAFSFIGARQVWGAPDNFFQGKIDDLFIYDRALNDSEINALYTIK